MALMASLGIPQSPWQVVAAACGGVPVEATGPWDGSPGPTYWHPRQAHILDPRGVHVYLHVYIDTYVCICIYVIYIYIYILHIIYIYISYSLCILYDISHIILHILHII